MATLTDDDRFLLGEARRLATGGLKSPAAQALARETLRRLADLAERPQDPQVLDSHLHRAAGIAEALTAAKIDQAGDPWTVQDVLNVALGRGMDQLEQLHLREAGQP